MKKNQIVLLFIFLAFLPLNAYGQGAYDYLEKEFHQEKEKTFEELEQEKKEKKALEKILKERDVGLLLSQEEKILLKDQIINIAEDPKKVLIDYYGDLSLVEIEKGRFGNSLPMTELINLYNQKKYLNAIRGFAVHARKDNALAQEYLGLMHAFGQGVELNEKTALNWFHMAADNGRPLSQHHLGIMYFNGRGTDKNIITALTWIFIAAESYEPGESRDRALKDMEDIKARLTQKDTKRAMKKARKWFSEYKERVRKKEEEQRIKEIKGSQ